MDALCTQIREAAGRVMSELGQGHSEAIYHSALELELRTLGIPYQREVCVPILYTGMCIGAMRADLVVDGKVVVELKATCTAARHQDRAQIEAYVRASSLTGLLLNFVQSAANETQLEVHATIVPPPQNQ